jgi:transcription termination factor Rho
MNERRRPPRRGRGPRPHRPPSDATGEPNPYRDAPESDAPAAVERENGVPPTRPALDVNDPAPTAEDRAEPRVEVRGDAAPEGRAEPRPDGAPEQRERPEGREPRPDRGEGRPDGRRDQRDGGFGSQFQQGSNGHRRGRRNRGRGPRPERQERPPMAAIVADAETTGWFDSARDGGYIRRPGASYLPDTGDAFVPPHLVRQFGLRRGDAIQATVGRDNRGRVTVVEIQQINGADPAAALRRPDFSSLVASYPDRKLTLETGRPAKGGPELTRRAIDLIAPIGFGQRALIVAPARAGKTMLLQAITEGVATNHPNAVLLVLLVDERPEEVSEMITWGYGEVVASSFDMPAERHTDVADMVLERSRRLVEMGKDVVIVLDSITRLARAHNTVERGTGRTLSGGLDATAMAKPKAFFGSARAVAPQHGGGSLTIIATALVETGSRMDDVIFEEFKGTGNCEIKLDRSLAEKRIYPAIDIATSGTRREEKLFRPDQIDSVFTLRRGLHQMPPQAAMEWMIKRIAATPNNDQLLSGL